MIYFVLNNDKYDQIKTTLTFLKIRLTRWKCLKFVHLELRQHTCSGRIFRQVPLRFRFKRILKKNINNRIFRQKKMLCRDCQYNSLSKNDMGDSQQSTLNFGN